VRDGCRLFFIPFERPSLREELISRLRYHSHSGNRELETALTETLADIPFSLEWLGYDRKPLWLYFGMIDALCVFTILLVWVWWWLWTALPAPLIAARTAVLVAACLLVVLAIVAMRHILPSLEETMRLYHAPQDFPCEPIDESEYLAHIDFQTSFMSRPLPRPLYPLNTKAYLRYDNGADGLVSETEVPAGVMTVDAPPFPLKKLMGFLAGMDW
jgi:hypothetical protein